VPEVDDRARALETIATLAHQHALSSADIAAAIGGTSSGAREHPARAVLVHVLGYLGGTFVFAGLGVFIATQWSGMNSTARVVVTLGSGVVAFVLAIVSNRDARFDKATTPLFLIAAVLEPTGMLVAFQEFGTGGDPRVAVLVTAGAMALQFGLTFGAVRRSTLIFMIVLFGTFFFGTALDLLGADAALLALVLGASLLLAAVGVDRTPHRDITSAWYLFGAAAFLYGVFDLVENTLFETVFIAIAAVFVYLSVIVHSRMLLFVSTIAILAYTAWFTGEHFADSVGWPVALIAFGLFMIGLSAMAVRIDRIYVRGKSGRGAVSG
jgi:hypothetical protein